MSESTDPGPAVTVAIYLSFAVGGGVFYHMGKNDAMQDIELDVGGAAAEYAARGDVPADVNCHELGRLQEKLNEYYNAQAGDGASLEHFTLPVEDCISLMKPQTNNTTPKP